MTNILSGYSTVIFDCDGVVLNSNPVKTKAFYEAVLPYGENAAKAMVEYHLANGGISRYKKFEHFLQQIVPEVCCDVDGPSLDNLLSSYAERVWSGLLTCEVAGGLERLRGKNPNSNWLIASGGDQVELRNLFELRGISNLFNGGVFGSPDSKEGILEREKQNGNIGESAVFIGDSKYDYFAAKQAGFDFLFVWEWTEVKRYEEWCRAEGITFYKNLGELS
ncbi:HAD family hydrolase [Pseudomonas flexibilis]|uniref:phosphoglycolate phosphatase n=1 Tax=Pseudomonas flexibilis TaxID=706570 RepID=A0A1N6WYB7_9PSED|nr:HAD family hydrolase [Pseudomonas flexibilis]SIQ95048.1 Phosphoglycolate phosphatase, HAD superfamily [Pseudomonas flexibilis]